jgi:hypothetical protein
MDTAQSYHRLALDCLKIAQAAHDTATQDEMIRLAQLWASLTDQVEDKASAKTDEEYAD